MKAATPFAGGPLRRAGSAGDIFATPPKGETQEKQAVRPDGEQKRAIIIGAGPAGLTAAYELLTRTGIVPLVLEKSEYLGGLARTVNYKGNRIDIGGHRFFSKSQRVMRWWFEILPLDGSPDARIAYQGQTANLPAQAARASEVDPDRAMLLRPRKSRIYFRRSFFEYPITLSFDTVRKLGFSKTIRIGLSYLRAVLVPIRPEENLEQFFINRFGRELYLTFFKSYTEKVWGMHCSEISAEWGAQRVKGLSIFKAFWHVLKKIGVGGARDFRQKHVETSLIEQFLYPKFGPGQMWEEVGERVRRLRGEIAMRTSVVGMEREGERIVAVIARDEQSGQLQRLTADYFFSTMPVKELVAEMSPAAPAAIREIAAGLIYRDFIMVGVLCERVKLCEKSGEPVKDNWIYIQEPDVLVGRLQMFNNWSPFLVADPDMVWIGMEYFCNEGDALWVKNDDEIIELAKMELAKIDIAEPQHVRDATVIRMPKTYPAYFGSYNRFPELVHWIDQFKNLFLIGRNGMHKYNNQDHSMLAAMTAVDNIVNGVASRENLWALNTEQEHHEECERTPSQGREPETAVS